MEHRNPNTLSMLVRTLQPAVSLDLMPHMKVNDRKRRFPGNSHSCDESHIEDILRASRILIPDNADTNVLLTLNNPLSEKLESALLFWEKIALDAGEGITRPPDSSLESCDGILRTSGIDMNSEPKTPGIPEVGPHSDEPNTASVLDAQTSCGDQAVMNVRTGSMMFSGSSFLLKILVQRTLLKFSLQGMIHGAGKMETNQVVIECICGIQGV